MTDVAADRVVETAAQRAGVRAFLHIRRCIEEGRFPGGARLPTEQEMADELRVSRTAIRRALDRLESEGYLMSRKGRGRMVARGAGRGDLLLSHTVVFLTSIPARPELHRMSGWMEAVEIGAVEAVTGAGWHALRLHPARVDEECIRHVAAAAPPGLIVTHDVTDNDQGRALVARFREQGVRVVVNGDWPGLAPYDRVVPDHETGAYELTRWLLQRGSRRILRVWSANEGDYWVQARTRGHERAMREAGLDPLPPVWVKGLCRGDGRSRDEFEMKMRLFAGYLVDWLRGGERPDALMATTDSDVFPIAAACRRLGALPNEDLALVGYDNSWPSCPERQYEPVLPLATVDKRNHEGGRLMAQLLFDRIAGKLGAESRRVLVRPELVLPGEDSLASGGGREKS